MTHRTTPLRSGAALVALVAALGGCDNGLTELNRNPNEPVRVSAEFLFPNATEALTTRLTGSTLNLDLTGLWVQHYAESRYSEQDRYELGDATISTHWTGFYAGPLQDFHEVVLKGDSTGRPNVAAMGRVMRSLAFQVVTDLWGDVGYSDALRGREGAMTVAYDPQAEIYAGLLDEVRQASPAIDPGGPSLGNADLIYRSDMLKWRRFANSLRLRLAMRLSHADPARARADFAAALAEGVFASNADNATLRYVDDGINVHPLHAYYRTAPSHAVSATLVDTLLHLADPRLPVFADPNKGGRYRGMPNGTLSSLSLDSLSSLGAAFRAADARSTLMSYAEVLFLQAEAAARGWTAGDAEALYRQGIAASMQQHGIAQPAIDAYLAQPAVAYAGLPSIALQKWIALYGNGPEAYAEWRRTGYPQLRPGPDAENDGRVPLRLPYPAIEASLNAANLQQAVTRQGGASLNDPVWWDAGDDG